MTSLYALGDVDACAAVGTDLVQLVRHWTNLGIRRIQIRAKSLGSGDYLELLQRVVGAVPASVEVYANDRADLAELAGCAGVHVGQGDLPVEVVKQAFPRLHVGVSTHDLSQLEHALAAAPDYVAFGPVFPTPSKRNPEPCVGVEGLRQASLLAARAGIPLVAIGGIAAENLRQVSGLCDSIALIGALTAADPAEVTRRYEELVVILEH